MRALSLLSLFLPAVALAGIVEGTLPPNTTWTAAGSPWTIRGDVTVPVGATLTIEPGASVVFSTGDSMGSGTDASRTELIIQGTVQVQGTLISPVTVTATNGYGIRVLSGGTLTIDHTNVSSGSGRRGIESAGTVTANNTSFTGGTYCLYVSGGTTTFNTGTLSNCSTGLHHIGGTANVSYSVIRGTSNHGAYIDAPATLSHNTITNNTGNGIYVDTFSGTVTLVDNAITDNSQYGMQFYTSVTTSPSRSVHHNNVWNNGYGNYSSVTPGAGSISENPLYVGTSNFTPTTNSPLRMAASDMGDIGAFAYAGDPTPTLQGVLYTDLTLTGANTVTGDLRVRSGVTLTVAPGASVTFATTDAQLAGVDVNNVELIVDGTLAIQGTAASRVSITETSAYGIRVGSGGVVTLDYADLVGGSGSRGIDSAGTVTASNSTITGGTYCLYVTGGTMSFNTGTLSNCTTGLYHSGGTSNLAFNLIRGTTSNGAYIDAPATLSHNTIANNTGNGIYVDTFSGTVTLVDNAITDNSQYGVQFYTSVTTSPSRSVHHNNVWNNGYGNYSSVTPGAGSISENPLYVGGSSYKPTSNSPLRKAASDGAEIGAFAYSGDPTPDLQGVLHTSLTLTGANTVKGDLTIPTGVTLTLAPGASLTLATTDAQLANVDPNNVEIIVRGTLAVQGAAGSRVSITETSAYGIRVLSGGVVTMDYADLVGGSGSRGIESAGTVTAANSTITGGTYCLYVTGGSMTFNSGTLSNCATGLYHVGGTANLASNLIRGTTGHGAYIDAPATLSHNTITNNTGNGIYVDTFSGTVTLVDNAITDNSQYGVQFYTSVTTSPSRSVHHNNVWNNGYGNYSSVTPGAASISENPLYVSTSNFTPTTNSPLRMAASDGGDIGAFAYAGDPTPTLQGVLFADLTLTGANTVAGDLRVRSGVTLTVAPGASVTFATTDAQLAGVDVNNVELIVDGTLAIEGTAASRVSITETSAYGIRVGSGGVVTLDYADLVGGSGSRGIESAGTVTASNSTISGGSYCLYVTGGTMTFNSGRITGCGTGLYHGGGTASVAYSLIKGTTSHGAYIDAPATLSHNTIANNTGNGIYVDTFSGTVTLVDNAITDNSQYGVQFYTSVTTSPTRSVRHNNVWNNGYGNYSSVSPGTGSISANPLYVSPGFNYTLQETSPCRNAASDGTDIGAFPYMPVGVDRIVISPASPTIAVNGTQQYTATAYDAQNNPLPSTTFTWSASAAAGTISSTGLFTAGCTPGTYTAAITASGGGKSATASVTLTVAQIATVTVSPSSAILAPNGTQQFSATAKDACNNVVTTPFTWLVTAGGGSISTGGLFTANATPGTYTNTVRASAGGINGFASVTVQTAAVATLEVSPSTSSIGINGTQQFSAIARDASGNVVPATITWSVINGGGTIDSNGLFLAGTTPGTFTNTVRATSGSITGHASVTVTPGPLASITVNPSTATLGVNGAQQFMATGKDAAGNTVPVSVTWSVVNGGGTINSTGLFTAGTTPGTFTNTVRATSGSITGHASVTVQAGALASITVAPSTATLGINGTQQFTATGKDASGNTVPVTVTWSVANGGGSINSSGLFTAGTTPGTFTNTVRATSGSITGHASITVQPGALASLVLSPSNVTLSPSGTQQFTATGKDAAGNTVPATVTWSVVNGGGTISTGGLFTAGSTSGTFAQTVKAQSGSITAFASVEVTSGVVQTVTVTPGSVSMKVRGIQTFTAEAKDSFGNVIAATPTWSIASATAGTIDPSGAFTAGGVAGSYPGAVVATIGGVSGSADVTLAPGDLAKVVVSPPDPTVAAAGVVQFSAIGEDSDGNLVAVTPSWSVHNGAGSITQTGTFTATQVPGSYPEGVRATFNGIVGSANVTVTSGAIARVAIVPANPTVAVNGTVSFTARPYDAFDNEILGLSAQWSVLRGGGVIDDAGVFVAGTESGTYLNTIQATVSGVSATTSVEIAEDFDGDGLPDTWELAHGFDPRNPGDAKLDPDGDALDNLGELQAGTDPNDADSDDDGVLDGHEQRPGEDTDGDGLVNALDPDSDNDGLLDGTEMAVTAAHADTDLSRGAFVADADPTTSTDPLVADTDGDGRKDGEEDLNHDGRVDEGETDPNVPDTFCEGDAQCGGDGQCAGGVCVPGPGTQLPEDSGCGCGATQRTGSVLALFGAMVLLARGRRRRFE